jgi:hypothetical protein
MRSLELLESLFGSTVTAAVDEATRGVPLLPLIDQWAALPCRLPRSMALIRHAIWH